MHFTEDIDIATTLKKYSRKVPNSVLSRTTDYPD